MGRPPWILIVVSVSLLLDPTFGDVLVRQGYDEKSTETLENSAPVVPNYVSKSQPIVQPQQTYNVKGEDNPIKQLLQYQHKIQQQQLQSIHQQERDQLLKIQHQQLQHPAVQQPQLFSGNDVVVGTSWGVRPAVPSALPAMGGFKGGRLFSLGPFGLNTFSHGGFGGLTPILLSTNYPQQMTGSSKNGEKSNDQSSRRDDRKKRDLRNGGESIVDKKSADKFARSQQINVAENSALNLKKFNTGSQNYQGIKSNEKVVGDKREEKNGEERVGGTNLLDPFGLVDKTENLLGNLKQGLIQNPLDILNGRENNPPPSWLREENSENQQFEEHVVSKPNKYQSFNGRESQGPIITGGEWKYMNMQQQPPLMNPTITNYPAVWPNQQNPLPPPPPSASPYGMYTTTQTTYGQSWNGGRSNGNEGDGMINEGRQWLAAPPNPSLIEKSPMMITPDANQMSKSQYPSSSSSINSNGNQMLGSSNTMSKFSSTEGMPGAIIGTLYNPVTGSAIPAAWNGHQTIGRSSPNAGERLARNDMVGNILTDAMYDVGSRIMGYNRNLPPFAYYNVYDDEMPGRSFEIDDLFDNGYYNNNNNNHYFNNGGGIGYDRFYGTGYDDGGFYGNRGGYPMYHQRPYRPHIF